MILEDLAPGARRRTDTAGTTEASLLGLLDVENHTGRLSKQGEEVNKTFPAQTAGLPQNQGTSAVNGARFTHSSQIRILRNFETRDEIEPPIKVSQTLKARTGAPSYDAMQEGNDI